MGDDRRRGRGLLVWGIVAALLVAIGGFWMLRSAPPQPAQASKVAPDPARAPAPPSAARARATPLAAPAAVPSTPSHATPFNPFSFVSPEATVSTQVRLVEEGDDEDFRETFIPAIRDKVTPEAIAACRKRLAQVRVQPDWEMAEDTVENGERVERVSMWGKSMTGFHDQNGRWLADALWCVPTGLP